MGSTYGNLMATGSWVTRTFKETFTKSGQEAKAIRREEDLVVAVQTKQLNDLKGKSAPNISSPFQLLTLLPPLPFPIQLKIAQWP